MSDTLEHAAGDSVPELKQRIQELESMLHACRLRLPNAPEEAVRELAESEERFALAVRGTNDGIWDWDIRSGEVFFSPRWKRMVGYEDDELPDNFTAFEKLLHPEDHDRVMATLNEYLDNQSQRYSVEFRFRHKDGSWRWILARGRDRAQAGRGGAAPGAPRGRGGQQLQERLSGEHEP
jgi:PAS domain S-box-containing protein